MELKIDNETAVAMEFTVIILAGGESRRMGDDKAFTLYRGRPLISYSIDLARSVSQQILIAGSQPALDDLGWRVVRDQYQVRAALTGIHAGLAASCTDWNLILTCDMPYVTRGLIVNLSERLNDELKIVVPFYKGHPEPLCGFYHRSLLPVIESNIDSGMMSPLSLFESVPHEFIIVGDPGDQEGPGLFTNINTRADLKIS